MIVSEQLNYIKTRRFHAVFMPVLIEFSRCIGTYSSAKFEFTFKRRKYLVEQFLCLMEKSARNDVNGEYDIGVVLTAKGEFLNDDEEIFGTEVLPIAKLAGDDYICLDYRKKRGITVAIWYGGESEEFHPVLRKIANSFSDFLNMINESWEY